MKPKEIIKKIINKKNINKDYFLCHELDMEYLPYLELFRDTDENVFIHKQLFSRRKSMADWSDEQLILIDTYRIFILLLIHEMTK